MVWVLGGPLSQLLGRWAGEGHLVSFQGGGSHDDAQIGAPPLHLLQQPQQRVGGQAALMRLVHHHHTGAPSMKRVAPCYVCIELCRSRYTGSCHWRCPSEMPPLWCPLAPMGVAFRACRSRYSDQQSCKLLHILGHTMKRWGAYLYCVRRGSSNISRMRTPSVQKRILVTPCMQHCSSGLLQNVLAEAEKPAQHILCTLQQEAGQHRLHFLVIRRTGAQNLATTASRTRNCQALLHESWPGAVCCPGGHIT